MQSFREEKDITLKSIFLNQVNVYAGLYKKQITMAQLNFLWTGFNVAGILAWFWTFLEVSFFNVDPLTRAIVSTFGALFVVIRTIDYAVTRYRKHKSEMIDIRKKESEQKQLELSIRRTELEIVSHENKITEQINILNKKQ